MVDFAALARRRERLLERRLDAGVRVRCIACRRETYAAAPLPAWPDTHCSNTGPGGTPCTGRLYEVTR